MLIFQDSPKLCTYKHEPNPNHQIPLFILFFQFLQNLMNCKDENFLTYIQEEFTSSLTNRLISQMNTKNFQERDIIKLILHKIYEIFIPTRENMRNEIANTFYTVTYEKFRHYGVPGLLEITSAIFSGLAKPVRSQYTELLFRAVLPLSSTEHFVRYNCEFCKCIYEYLNIQPMVINEIIISILKFWPARCKEKTLWFMQTIEVISGLEIFNLGTNLEDMSVNSPLENPDFNPNLHFLKPETLIKIVNLLVQVLGSDIPPLTEKALNILKSAKFVKMIKSLVGQSLTNPGISSSRNQTSDNCYRRLVKSVLDFRSIKITKPVTDLGYYLVESTHWNLICRNNQTLLIHLIGEMDNLKFQSLVREYCQPAGDASERPTLSHNNPFLPLLTANASLTATMPPDEMEVDKYDFVLASTQTQETQVLSQENPFDTSDSETEEPRSLQNLTPSHRVSAVSHDTSVTKCSSIGIDYFPASNYLPEELLRVRLRKARNFYINFD